MRRQKKSKKAKKEKAFTTAATVMVDPNWKYANFGAKKHGAAKGHYNCSPVGTICEIPVQSWSRPNSNLLLWGTLPKLDQAIDVMRAWDYNLITAVPWIKTCPNAAELAKGIGFWFQASAEVLLICSNNPKKTNAPKYKKFVKPDGLLCGPKGNMVFYARRGPHSRKPLSFIEWVESYLPGPYLELFATGERPGWTTYGHNVGTHLHKGGVMPLAKAREMGLVEKIKIPEETEESKKVDGNKIWLVG